MQDLTPEVEEELTRVLQEEGIRRVYTKFSFFARIRTEKYLFSNHPFDMINKIAITLIAFSKILKEHCMADYTKMPAQLKNTEGFFQREAKTYKD